MTQQQHGGFFASVPRIVRTQYKDLSASEKWLYTCLKDLCGDRGTCFRNLRTLSVETGLSTGSLSTMIPNLHKAGLVHAEKKPRGLGGKEVWHISIVDIWQSNAAYCSISEQPTAPHIVQELNNQQSIVQELNEESEYCSNSEPSCSNFVDRRRILEEEKREEDTIRAPEQTTEEIHVATLPLRDEEGETFFSYSDEPPDSAWLWEEKDDAIDIFAEEDLDPTEKRPAIKGGDLAPGDGEKPYSAATKESDKQQRREGSGEMPAVKKPPTPPGQPPASPGRAAELKEHPTAQSTRSDVPRQPTSEKPTGEPPSSESTLPSTKETNGKGKSKKGEPLLCETSKIRLLLDANRGYVLEEKGAIIHQNLVIKEWCGRHPLEHYHKVVTYLSTRDPFWSKEDRVHRFFNADKLASETPRVLAKLGMTEKPLPPPGVPGVPIPVSRGNSASYAPVMAARPR